MCLETSNQNAVQEEQNTVNPQTETQATNICPDGLNSIEGEELTSEFVDQLNEKVSDVIGNLGSKEMLTSQDLFDLLASDKFSRKELIYMSFQLINEEYLKVLNPMDMLAQMLRAGRVQ